MNVQRVKVNIVPGGIVPVANLSQGDYGREIMFEVFDGNSPADLSDVQTAFLSGEKPDGKAFSLNGTITNNCVSVTSTYQSTVLSGNIEAKLVLIDSDSQLKSALLIWAVEHDPSSGSVSSDEDIQDIISAALEIKDEAAQNAYNAGQSALAAATSASEASDSETNAATSESNAEAWAVGERGGVPVESTDETYHNNSKYYSDYAESIAERLPEGFNPKGTITFSQLPSIADSFVGDTWNISDAFVTTSDFRRGAGISVDADSFVYLTLDHQWDVLSVKLGGVQGVKGNEETNYRTGNVNLTPANIGALATDGDSKDNTVTFTSSDDDTTTDKTSDGFTSVATMASGETHASLFQKISKMFLNIRKLWNTTSILVPIGVIFPLMGISAPTGYLICDGTVYNISAYPALADYFNAQFGSKNKFGGNGTTTFAVPDLRGEFLRGTGTNSYTNQGNGGTVGQHQDATEIPYMGVYNTNSTSGSGVRIDARFNTSANTGTNPLSYDSVVRKSITAKYMMAYSSQVYDPGSGDTNYASYSARPTNTSVTYIIKAFA